MNNRTPSAITRAVHWALAGAALATTPTLVNAAEDKAVERIEVTGSRIKRTDIEGTQPVLAITRDDIDRSGLATVGEVLKEITTNGASLGLQTNNGNTGGSVTVDLRNCGSNRTLVLLNGRRWVSQLGGSVDLSTIPLAAVKNIEVLKDGASAIYGTDAVCGVVNVLTNNDFEGAEATAYYGITSEGDGEKQAYSMTIGGRGEKASALINVGYTQQEKIMGGDRKISSTPIDGLPANISVAGGRASPVTPYGQYRAAGVNMTLDPANPGCRPNVDCTAVGDFRPYNGNTDGYNFAPTNYILQPNETTSLFTQGSYDLRDNLRVKAEIMHNERTSQAQLAAQPLSGMAISAANVYNPFNTAITGASFRPIVAPRAYTNDVDTWRYGITFDGDFELAGRNFTWDIGSIYSDNEALQQKSGFFNSTRVTTANGPSFIDTDGIAKCGTAAAPIAGGCVPFNIFGGPTGVTQQMLDYMTVAPRDITYSNMHDFSANITGDVFELPAGPVGMAFGVEKRRQSGYTSPDPLTVAGQVLGDNAATPTKGGYSLEEAYLEANLPILNDLPGVDSLELKLATRYSDYSNFGATQNSSFGIAYRPFEDLLIRLSRGEGFRAPSITELYQGQNDSRPTGADPCDVTSDIYAASAGVRARCAAAGIPTDFEQAQPQFRAKVGGNPNTQPEISTTETIGFAYSPSFVDGLGITLDWYNIRIENSIGTLSAQTIVDDCYVSGIAERCSLITRDMTGAEFGNPGEISNILALGRNFIGGTEIEGVDLNIDYRFNTTVGDFHLNADTAYTDYYGDLDKPGAGKLDSDGFITDANQVGSLDAGASGGGSFYRLKSNLTLAWEMDVWSASLTAQYLSKQREDCSNVVNAANALKRPELKSLCSAPDDRGANYAINPDTGLVDVTEVPTPHNELEPMWYFDAQAGWKAPWDGEVTVGIRNLTDEDPPHAYSAFANTYDPNYRIPGQSYYMSYKQKF